MSELSTILEQLHSYRKILNTDLDTVSPRTRAGFETSQREAKDNIAAALKEYEEKLFSSSICFYPHGEDPAKVANFIDVAVSEAPTMLQLNARSMYADIALKIWPSMGYRHQFTMDCFSTLVRELRYIGQELGVDEMSAPRYGEPFACSKLEELVDYVAHLVQEAMGHELNKLYLRRRALNYALATEHTGALPVILENASPEEAQVIAEGFTVFAPVPIASTTEITPEFAISTFKKYSKKQQRKAGKAE